MAKSESAYRYWNRLMRGVGGKDRSASRAPRKNQKNNRRKSK